MIFVIIVVAYIFQLKRQIQRFSSEVDRLKSLEYNQVIKVDVFDKDLVALAIALNESVDIQKEIKLKYIEERKKSQEIIAGISHDFRTPLTATRGYLQMIQKKGVLSGEEAEYLSIAISKTDFLKELSDEFFEVSTIKANDELIDITKINLNNILTEIILEQCSWMEEHNINGRFDIPEETFMINSNEHYLQRIIDNLFSNARKYAKSNVGLKLQIEDGKALIKVYNDTIGYELIDIKKVFEPFYRGISRNKEGSGMGLYVVKCLAEKLSMEVRAYYEEIYGEKMFIIELIL